MVLVSQTPRRPSPVSYSRVARSSISPGRSSASRAGLLKPRSVLERALKFGVTARMIATATTYPTPAIAHDSTDGNHKYVVVFSPGQRPLAYPPQTTATRRAITPGQLIHAVSDQAGTLKSERDTRNIRGSR